MGVRKYIMLPRICSSQVRARPGTLEQPTPNLNSIEGPDPVLQSLFPWLGTASALLGHNCLSAFWAVQRGWRMPTREHFPGGGEHGTCNCNGFPRNLKQIHLPDPPMPPESSDPLLAAPETCCSIVLIKPLPAGA